MGKGSVQPWESHGDMMWDAPSCGGACLWSGDPEAEGQLLPCSMHEHLCTNSPSSVVPLRHLHQNPKLQIPPARLPPPRLRLWPVSPTSSHLMRRANPAAEASILQRRHRHLNPKRRDFPFSIQKCSQEPSMKISGNGKPPSMRPEALPCPACLPSACLLVLGGVGRQGGHEDFWSGPVPNSHGLLLAAAPGLYTL